MTTERDELAALLANHEDCAFSASGVLVCSCGVAVQPNEVVDDLSNLAAHQADVLTAASYRKPFYLAPGRYRNPLGVVIRVEALRLDRNIIGPIWDAAVEDGVFGDRYVIVTPEALQDAGYVRIDEVAE